MFSVLLFLKVTDLPLQQKIKFTDYLFLLQNLPERRTTHEAQLPKLLLVKTLFKLCLMLQNPSQCFT